MASSGQVLLAGPSAWSVSLKVKIEYFPVTSPLEEIKNGRKV